MRRSLLKLVLALCLGVSLLGAVAGSATAQPLSQHQAQPLAQDPVLEARLMLLAQELRCLVCQNESLAGSRSDLALDLRQEIRNLMRQGKTDAEILDFMVQRYGDFVLYRPPVQSNTLLLWGGPFVLLLLGAFLLIRVLRARQSQVVASTHVAAAHTPEEQARLAALLAGLPTPSNKP
jgi:cytochrome c-type biogenesis protein CcmH